MARRQPQLHGVRQPEPGETLRTSARGVIREVSLIPCTHSGHRYFSTVLHQCKVHFAHVAGADSVRGRNYYESFWMVLSASLVA